MKVPPPEVESYIVAGARRTRMRGPRIEELYPRQYATDGSLVSHLRFALRHEAFDLGVLVAALKAIDPVELEAWVRAAPDFDPADKTALIRLQGEIVDPRYAATDWRNLQNFVGQTVRGFREEVHFVGPRPEDVPGLMDAWMSLTRRVVEGGVDTVVAAAVSAFSFVFIHPFEDGNGRIHRFLLHHVLAKRGYSPPAVLFPVSAAILRDRRSYDDVLQTFSRPILEFIQWHWTAEREIVVGNETADLYRYYDATVFAEYLYDRVADTVRRDLEEELEFIAVFDRAFEAVREIVDMPDRRASLFVRLCMQNGGRLSAAKRPRFSELDDAEVAAMEAAVLQELGACAAEIDLLRKR